MCTIIHGHWSDPDDRKSIRGQQENFRDLLHGSPHPLTAGELPSLRFFAVTREGGERQEAPPAVASWPVDAGGRSSDGTDESTAEQRRRTGGMSRKLSTMKGNPGGRKSNWIRRGERQPACGGCGVGSGLVHIKLWRGKWSGSRGGNNSTTPWQGGRVRGEGCVGGVGVPAEQVAFCSSSLFNQPFFGQKPPRVLHRPRASGTAGWIYRSIRRRRPSE